MTGMVKPPADALPVVATVSVVEPEPVTVVGLKLPVTPDGSPAVPKLTVPPKPLRAVTVTVYAVLPPAATLAELGDIPREKSGCGTTVNPNVVVTPEYIAVNVTGVDMVTLPAPNVKVAEVAPDATVTNAGTVAAEGFELESATTAPPAGAGAVRLTVPVPPWPLAMVPGDTDTALNAAGRGLMVDTKVLLPPA